MSLGNRLADWLLEDVEAPSGLSDIFEEEPVPLKVFVEDKLFLDNPPLSPLQYEAVRHIEQIYYPETYPLMVDEWGAHWEPVRFVNFAWLQIGKGGGKDHLARISSLRIAYLLMCLKSPQKYFGMPPQDSIHCLNVASSAPQAYRAFFQPMRRAVERKGSWFHGRSHAVVGSIQYAKNIEAISGHSDAESQEGLNIILGVADEISAFKSRDELTSRGGVSPREPSKSAESIIEMIRTSARTRFPRVFKLAALSYPRFKGDAIQQLTNAGLEDVKKNGDKSRVYVMGPLATWEVNPRVKGPEDFAEDYARDPAMARAKYECKPEFSPNRFFRNSDAIYAAFSERRDPEPIEVEYYYGIDSQSGMDAAEDAPEDVPKVPGWQVRFHFSPDFKPMQGAQYAMHGDLAKNGDAAGCAMAHVRSWMDQSWLGYDEEGGEVWQRETRPVVKLDFVFNFDSDVAAEPVPREVQLRWFRKLCWELMARGFNIRRFTFDAWNSVDSIQILQSRGIESERVSTDLNNDVWNTLRDVTYDGRLEAYHAEPCLTELIGLTRLKNGKVDHSPYSSKDSADAAGCAVYGAVILGGGEGDEPEEAVPSNLLVEVFGGFELPEGIHEQDLSFGRM